MEPPNNAPINPKSFAEALKGKYVDDVEDEDIVVSGKRVEMVGMSAIQSKFAMCNKLRTVSVRSEGVSSAGDPGEVKSLCPNIVELDLASSMFHDWQVVTDICCQLTALAFLDLSCNALNASLVLPENANISFCKLKRLVLNKTQVPWIQVEALAQHLPQLEELHLESNRMTKLPTEGRMLFPTLQVMNLTDNAITSWDDLTVLETLPQLHTLVLNQNKLSTIITPKDTYTSLTSLSIAENPISEAVALNALGAFLGPLQSLRISPLVEGLSSVQSRMMIVPRLPQLVTLNGSKITPKERSDSQKHYLKTCAQQLTAQYSIAHHTDDCSDVPAEFLDCNPQYAPLVAKHFNPLPPSDGTQAGGSAQQAMGMQTTTVTLRSLVATSMTKGDKQKKLPATYTIAKLKVMFQTLFGLEVDRQKLVARLNSGDGIDHASELNDEFSDLQFYCITDGTVIEMHERDLEAEAREEARKKQEQEDKMQQQMKDAQKHMDMVRSTR
uniref:Ubiquitin-like domain-containing protein n=1 Tax=Eutreptiella gymnastica TaxID=73025 RepID=A0A7S4FHY2_9EUGL